MTRSKKVVVCSNIRVRMSALSADVKTACAASICSSGVEFETVAAVVAWCSAGDEAGGVYEHG